MILDADTENQSVDIPAEAPEYEVAVRNKVAEAFRARRPEPPTGRMGMERAGESAAGALISAFGGAPIAESLSYLAHHIKKARILSKLPVAGKLFDAQMEITENLGREWALGAKRVSDQLLPTEQQKGDIYERGGSFAGGLVALPAIAEQFGALGVAALGAGQAGAPAYFETLQKTGDETKAIRAMLPALGVGATYAVPAAKILGGLNKASGGLLSSELFRLMFATPAAEGALAVGQSAALDAIMEHATGEDRKFLQDGIEQGAFGFATTFVFGLLGAGKARLAGRAAEAPGAPAAEAPGAPAAEAAPQAHVEAPSEAAGVGGHPPSAEQQEAAKRSIGAMPRELLGLEIQGPVYHVSGKGSEIEKAGELRASKEGVNQGGLGGITEEPGVSVTTKREKAELYQKELDRLRDLSNAATQDEALDLLRRFRDEDARLDPGLATEAYQEAIAKAKHQVSKGADPLDATFNAYRDEYLRRRGAGNFQGGKHPGLENPNLIGERSGFKGNEPARIFEVQKGQIPEGHKISKGQDEGELRIGGDVPLGGRAVSAEEVRMTSGVLKGRKNDIVELYAGGPSPFRNVTTKSVLALAKRNLISTGDTPRTARRELELAHGAVKAELAEATRHARKLDVEARKAFGRDWANGKGGQQIKDALENSDLIRDLPENMRRPVALLREHLDRLSRRLIETGAAKGPMVGIIERNLGEYVTKAHQAYTDPEWADKVPEDVRNRLFSLWKSWSMPISKGELGVLEAASKQEGEAGRLAQMELAGRKDFLDMSEDEIRGEMDAILQRAKEHADNPFAHIASGKLGRKDLSIFKHRKTIPKELHDFLGEVNSPIAAYANSVVKMAGVAAKHEAFTAIRRTGLGSFLHEKPTGKFTARLSADGNAGLRPLDGLYTTPEIKKALTEIGPGEQHALIKLALKANAVVRWGKVVGQPWATVRNLLGNFPTMVANGHLPWVGMESWKKAFSKGDLGELKEAIKLGVIGDAISTYELSDVREMLKKAPTDLGQDKSALASVKGMAERLFAAGDIGPKLSAWAQEWKALVKAGMSEPAAKELAADRIRDTMPTPERMAPFLKKWRGQPVLGNYFAFSSEIIRNLGNRMRLIGSELKSPNPKIRAMGYKRVAGQLAALTVVPAAVYAYNSLNGIDSEEDADRRNFVPPWDKESRLVWSGTKKKGRYFDLSDVDPMMTFADPVARMLQGEDPTEAGLAAVKEYAQRVFGLSPIAQVAVELYSSRDKNGAPIKDVAAYLNKNLSPGFALSYQRGNENGFGPEVAAAASGVRSYDFDPEKSLKYKAFAFQDEIRKVSMQINDLKDRRDLDPDEKRSLRKMAESERKALFKGLHEMSRSAIRLGIPIYKVEDTLDATLSEDVTDAILSGYYIPYGEKE